MAQKYPNVQFTIVHKYKTNCCPHTEARPKDVNMYLCLLEYTTFYSLLLSHAPEELRPQLRCATPSVTILSLSVAFVYSKHLKELYLISDLLSLTHLIYVFLGSPQQHAPPIMDHGMTALSQTKATKQYILNIRLQHVACKQRSLCFHC